jgi:hypothetical protein
MISYFTKKKKATTLKEVKQILCRIDRGKQQKSFSKSKQKTTKERKKKEKENSWRDRKVQ